jgi:hypothetical protein
MSIITKIKSTSKIVAIFMVLCIPLVACAKVSTSSNISGNKSSTLHTSSIISQSNSSSNLISSSNSGSDINASTSNTNNPNLLPIYNPGHMEAYLSEKTTGCTYSISNGKYIFLYSDGSKSPITPFAQNDFDKNNFLPPNQNYPPFVSSNKTAIMMMKNNSLTVAYSNDKGKSWNYSNPIVNTKIRGVIGDLIPLPLSSMIGCGFVSFPSENVGYLIIDTDLGAMNHYASGIFKTTDGGKNWLCMMQTNTVNTISGLTFTSDSTGYFTTVCTAGNILDVFRTADGGTSWTDTSLKIPNDSLGYEYSFALWSPYFIGNKGYMATLQEEKIKSKNETNCTVLYYCSTDNGVTWNYDPSLNSQPIKFSIGFFPSFFR